MKATIYTRVSTTKQSSQLKVVLYTRVRADNQEEQISRSKAQENCLREFAMRNNMLVVAHYHDTCSANGISRSQFGQFMKDVESEKIKPNLIICTSIDRISRSYDFVLLGNFLDKYNIKLKIALA